MFNDQAAATVDKLRDGTRMNSELFERTLQSLVEAQLLKEVGGKITLNVNFTNQQTKVVVGGEKEALAGEPHEVPFANTGS